VVTGAAGGIGSAIVERALADGATVIACDRRSGEQSPRATGSDEGRPLSCYEVDVADETQVTEFAADLRTDGVVVTGLVNVHGIQLRSPIVDIATKAWELVLRVNLTASFYLIREFAPTIAQAESGRIINFSTAYGQSPGPGQAAYVAAKAGVEGMTRSAALEYAATGMTVNAIAPGLIWHEGLEGVWPQEEIDALAAKIPSGRVGRPQEVAGLVGYLLSAEAGYINGQVLHIDGALCLGS
jgi:NAD(P)-dependent dehydrogenase (short-subunit alcohol dehydrogenase family)